MVMIQLLLPVPSRQPAEGALRLAETRGELAGKFNGVTAYLRAPAKGLWTAPDGHTEEDEVVMVEVVTDHFDKSWWRAYGATLARRFRQEAIHIRAIAVDTPDS
jgi:hypothetical protein